MDFKEEFTKRQEAIQRNGAKVLEEYYIAGWRAAMDDALKLLDERGHKEAASLVLKLARAIVMDGPLP